jgi:hypothetical protein
MADTERETDPGQRPIVTILDEIDVDAEPTTTALRAVVELLGDIRDELHSVSVELGDGFFSVKDALDRLPMGPQ